MRVTSATSESGAAPVVRTDDATNGAVLRLFFMAALGSVLPGIMLGPVTPGNSENYGQRIPRIP